MWVQNFDFFDLVRDGCLRLTRKRNKWFGAQFKSGSGEISEFSCHQVRENVFNNHVSVPTLSETLFFKIIHRVIFLKDLTPKHQVLESKPLITKENYQSVPKLIEDRRNRTKTWVQWTKIFQPKILGFLEKSQVDKWVSWTHFWSFRVGRGLYICLRHLPRALHVFLVVIPVSSAVFGPFFVRGVPTRTLEMRTHVWSLVLRFRSPGPFWTYFCPQGPYEGLRNENSHVVVALRSSTEVISCHEILSFVAVNGRIGSLSRKSSPRVTESV